MTATQPFIAGPRLLHRVLQWTYFGMAAAAFLIGAVALTVSVIDQTTSNTRSIDVPIEQMHEAPTGEPRVVEARIKLEVSDLPNPTKAWLTAAHVLQVLSILAFPLAIALHSLNLILRRPWRAALIKLVAISGLSLAVGQGIGGFIEGMASWSASQGMTISSFEIARSWPGQMFGDFPLIWLGIVIVMFAVVLERYDTLVKEVNGAA